jgi:AraC-like DNA-binding protein
VTLILDTASIPPPDRDEATRAVIEQMSVPTDVSLLGPTSRNTRMDVWQLGRINALRNDGRPVRLLRTSRHVRREAPEVVSMIVQLKGRCLHRQHGHLLETRAGNLLLCDLTGTYESDTGPATLATYISYDDLGMDVDVGRRAMAGLHTSPLYDLVRHHLAALDAYAESTNDAAAATSVGEATVELVRALLFSAAGDARQRDVLHDTLNTRIETYLRQNLRDARLCPELVAQTHHISVRTLHNLWSNRETTLMEWVMRERLEGARRELQDTAPGDGSATISHTAARWGFSDPTHFSRRFRAAYGMPPAAWRRAHRQPEPQPSSGGIP